jgi:hypothetical protein
MQKFECSIDGQKKTVIFIDHQPSRSKPKVGAIHHIQVLDRSGSMSLTINQLIDNVQATHAAMGPEDYLSIIWFSSPNQFKTLIKGAKKTDAISKMLDSIRSTIGSTCFSHPLKEAATIVKDLKQICSNVSITLFTDGQPVVPWSVDKEQNDCFDIVRGLGDSIMAFNTIGYGYNYDRNFLVDLAQLSQYGQMYHSSEIAQYLHYFNDNYARINGMVLEPVDISADQIMYLSGKYTKSTILNMHLRTLDADRNYFFIIGDGDFSFTYQGSTYMTKTIKKVTGAELAAVNQDFFYALAYNNFYAGHREIALSILAKNVKDKYLANKQINVFTYDEVANYLQELDFAVFNASARMKDGVCPPNFVPKADALCTMDVMTVLSKGNNFYLPMKTDYERTTRKVVDTENRFTASKDEVYAAVKDFIFNKERLNLSIRYMVPGQVSINPASAKRVGIPEKIDSQIFRNHTFILDGNMNVSEATFLCDMLTLAQFSKMGVPMDMISSNGNFVVNGTQVAGALVKIKFSKLPIINRTYIDNVSLDEIFTVTKEVHKLEAFQKVLNYYLDKVYAKGTPSIVKEGVYKKYTLDAIKVLEDHGIDKSGNYAGVNNVRPKAEDSDSYDVRTMEFYLKGCSSMPKVDDVLAGKKQTVSGDLIREAMGELEKGMSMKKMSINDPNVQLRDFLSQCKEDTIEQLQRARLHLATFKLAKILTGGWFLGLKTTDKGEFYYEKDGVTMIARADRVREYV